MRRRKHDQSDRQPGQRIGSLATIQVVSVMVSELGTITFLRFDIARRWRPVDPVYLHLDPSTLVHFVRMQSELIVCSIYQQTAIGHRKSGIYVMIRSADETISYPL